jgi:hypothetical protein
MDDAGALQAPLSTQATNLQLLGHDEEIQIPITNVKSNPPFNSNVKPRPILESEWPQLRYLLRRLYIEQDQSLKEVRSHLREERGLIATYEPPHWRRQPPSD